MLAVLDNNDRLQCLTDDYFDSSLHTFLQGTAAFFTCSVLQTAEIAQYFKVGNKLSFVSNEVSYHFDVTKMNKNEQLVTIQADSLTLELRNEFASEYKSPKAMTFKQYLDVFLFAGDNPLVMGINEVSDKSLQAEWTGDGESTLARLFSLANKFDAEIEFVTVLNKHWGLDKIVLNVYRAHSDKYQGIGKKRTDIIMEYGNNVETIEYEINNDDLKTAINPTGTDGLTISSVVIDEKDKNGNQLFYSKLGSPIIYAPQARDQFPSKVGGEGYIAKKWSYETTNANALAGQALAELKKLCEPKVTVTIKGYEYLGIGDTVIVQNTAYVPTLNLSARISEQEIYFDDPSKNASTFTNVEILKSEVDQSLIDRVNALIEQTKPYTLSIISDNGVNFKNSEGSTTLSAVVYSGTKDITADVTVRWYKNDVWVKTAYNVTVNASDIIDKAVYRAEVMDTNGVIRAKAEVTVFNVDDGRGIKGKPVLSYASSGSINTVHTTWQATIPAVPAGSYLWTREVTTYTDNTTSEVITPVLQGPKGDPGKDGKSITDSKQEWAASTSGTTAPTTWQTAIPTVSAGQYLWSRVTETWSDGDKTYRFTIGKIGENGQNAQMMFLSADKNTMMFNADNTAKFSQTATITAKYQNVSGTVTFTAKGIKSDGTSEALTLTGTGDSRTITSAMFKSNWVMITVTATLAGLTDVLSIVKVNDGAQGIGGAKGYFHSAWAMSADGKTGFSTTDSTGKWYIGTYFDFVEADSTDPTRYNWLELAGAVNMYFAYAWSEDGKDRFARKKPIVNMLGNIGEYNNLTDKTRWVWTDSSISAVTSSSYDSNTKMTTLNITGVGGYEIYSIPLDFTALKSGYLVIDFIFNRDLNSWVDNAKQYVPIVLSSSPLFGYEETGNFATYQMSNIKAGKRTVVIPYTNIDNTAFLSMNLGYLADGSANAYQVKIGNIMAVTDVSSAGSSFSPSFVYDYDNAVPRYIGRSLKDSNSQSDYKWEPNPERKPWTAYAQGVNGEDLSLMPYGENQITSALNTLNWKGDGWSGNTSFSSDGKKLIITALGGWRATRFKVPDELIGKKLTLSFNAILDGAKTTATEYTLYLANGTSGKFDTTTIANTSDIQKDKLVRYSTTFVMNETGYVGITTNNAPENSGKTTVWTIDEVKLELANTMNIPTPWTPAPSEDQLGAIPKYVGTAALPYEDWTNYAYTMNPEWADLNATLGLNTKVDNGQYQEDKSQIFEDIANRVTKEEAAETNRIAQKALDMITAYTDPDSGKAAADLNALEQRIVVMVNELGSKVARWNFIDTWMTAGEEGFSIANAKSTTKFLVKNNRMSFINNGEEVAYFSGQSFMIQRGIVTQGMQIGSHKEEALNKDHTVTRWIAT